MTRDASLDEFLGGDDSEAGTADAADTPPEDSSDSSPLSPTEVEPARSTHDWSPAGAECAVCGASVTARWRDEQGLVCAECKDW